MRPEGLGKVKTFIYLIRSRISDLPACSIVTQPLRYEWQSSLNNSQCAYCGHHAPDSSSELTNTSIYFLQCGRSLPAEMVSYGANEAVGAQVTISEASPLRQWRRSNKTWRQPADATRAVLKASPGRYGLRQTLLSSVLGPAT
jgi:hypothetical protein